MAGPDLLIEAGFSDAKLAAEVKKLTDKYREAGKAAEKAFRDSTASVGDNQAVRAHLRELDKLQRAYDPVYVATKKYEKSIIDLDRALKVGAIDQAKYTAEVSRAQVELGQVSGVATEAVKSTRNFGSMAQNVGYQVQDFAVQVGGGTSATRAFAQQFPQLASAFGPVGVALGTAAAVLVPLGVALLGSGEKALSASESVDALTKSTDAYVEAIEAAATPVEDLRRRYGELGDEIQRLSNLQVSTTGAAATVALSRAGKSIAKDFGIVKFADPEKARYDRLAASLGIAEDKTIRLVQALRLVDSAQTGEQAVRSAEKLYEAMVDAAGGVSEAAEKFGEKFDLIARYADAAKTLVTDALSHEEKSFLHLTDTYDKGTQKMASLAQDRRAAEAGLAQAVKDGNQEKADSYQRVLRAIDSEVQAVRTSLAEIDGSMDAFVARLREKGTQIGGAISGAIERATGWTPAQFGKDSTAAAKGILDLIASRESGGDYNATLDNGRWTGGPRDLVNMTLNQILALQRSMKTAENRKLYGNGKGSSALGRYQIVQTTLEGLIRDLGLSGNEMYDAKLQDRLATELVRRRRGQGVAGLREEWAGLGNVSPALINQALGNTEIGRLDPSRQADLDKEVEQRKRQAEEARKYGEQLAANLVTEQQRADLERQRVDAVAAIEAMNLSETDKAAALAEVNGEMQRQLTIMALMADAKRRQVDLDAQMVGSSMTYREAINALGDAKKQQVIVDQQAQVATQKAAEADQHWADQRRQWEDDLLDASLAGEGFVDVLRNIGKQLAKAALQASIFGRGPMAGGSGGGLLGLFGGFLGGGATVGNDVLSQALRGARGFSAGGYTGSGGRSDPAGIVHGGEYVMSAPAVQRIGLPTLDAIHRGQTGGGTFAPQTSIVIQGNADDQTITQLRRELDARDRRLRREMPAIMANHQQRAG